MKILFYTRLEGNTGGDETFLNLLQFYLLKKLSQDTEDTEVHLCLSYDSISTERAEKIKHKWEQTLKEKGLKGEVWLFPTPEKSFEKSIRGVHCKYYDLDTSITKGKNVVNQLDNTIIWYIKTKDGCYYERKGKELPQEPLKLKEGKDLPNIAERTCYFAITKSENRGHYPLYVMDQQILYYYKNIDDSSPKKFSLNRDQPRLLKGLPGKLQKGRKQIMALELNDLKAITTYTAYIPEEVLITDNEYQGILESFSITEDLTEKSSAWKKFRILTGSLDLFVMAGWAHLQSQVTAEYLNTELEIPENCKILLSSVPGMSVNGCNFVTGLVDEQNFKNVHVLQPGIGTNVGFPILPTLSMETIGDQEIRHQWVSHIKKFTGSDFLNNFDNSGQEKKDKLIVIYCSKDCPGQTGAFFLQNAKNIIKNPREYPVLLIGSDPQSKAYELWQSQCTLHGFKCVALPRTERTEILMRGFRDAEFSMATGAYSILEARYLKISHCEYLCPPHMIQLGNMLEKTQDEYIDVAFVQGQKALKELEDFPLPHYNGNLFTHESAWGTPDPTGYPGWKKYLKESVDLLPNKSGSITTSIVITEESENTTSNFRI